MKNEYCRFFATRCFFMMCSVMIWAPTDIRREWKEHTSKRGEIFLLSYHIRYYHSLPVIVSTYEPVINIADGLVWVTLRKFYILLIQSNIWIYFTVYSKMYIIDIPTHLQNRYYHIDNDWSNMSCQRHCVPDVNNLQDPMECCRSCKWVCWLFDSVREVYQINQPKEA